MVLLGVPPEEHGPVRYQNEASNQLASNIRAHTLSKSSLLPRLAFAGLGISFCFGVVFLTVADWCSQFSRKRSVQRESTTTEKSSKYGYGNPIRRPMKKVPRVVLGLQDHTLEVRTRHLWHKTTRKGQSYNPCRFLLSRKRSTLSWSQREVGRLLCCEVCPENSRTECQQVTMHREKSP